MEILRAIPEDSSELCSIAISSEAHWGFDDEYMKRFKEDYLIAPEYISGNSVYLLKADNNTVGFYAFNKEQELDYLYIHPDYMGKGYGKLLFLHMLEQCREMRMKTVYWITSPDAADFYQKMGAVQIGTVESKLKEGRMIPRFKINL